SSTARYSGSRPRRAARWSDCSRILRLLGQRRPRPQAAALALVHAFKSDLDMLEVADRQPLQDGLATPGQPGSDFDCAGIAPPARGQTGRAHGFDIARRRRAKVELVEHLTSKQAGQIDGIEKPDDHDATSISKIAIGEASARRAMRMPMASAATMAASSRRS